MRTAIESVACKSAIKSKIIRTEVREIYNQELRMKTEVKNSHLIINKQRRLAKSDERRSEKIAGYLFLD